MIIKQDKSIYTQLANKYNIPSQVVEVICNHPFKFASERIADDTNTKSIMFGYLFKFKLKKKFLEEHEANKTKSRDTRQSEGTECNRQDSKSS